MQVNSVQQKTSFKKYYALPRETFYSTLGRLVSRKLEQQRDSQHSILRKLIPTEDFGMYSIFYVGKENEKTLESALKKAKLDIVDSDENIDVLEHRLSLKPFQKLHDIAESFRLRLLKLFGGVDKSKEYIPLD